MRIPAWIAIAGLLAISGAAAAADETWPTYGHDYGEQRYSNLDQISTKTVGRLGLAWFLDLPQTRSLEATPLLVDGSLYFTTSWAVVNAVDARTGQLRWTYDPHSRRVLARHPAWLRMVWGTNRGVAYWDGRIFVGTDDGRLIALDAKTGKRLWSVRTFEEASARFITSAPRAFNGTVIIGNGGGDVGVHRGYVTAYDARTGRQRWRFYTVPGDPAKGFETPALARAAKTWSGEWWKYGGGGAVWNGITYDEEFNRVYIGTGNPEPWNSHVRNVVAGDNLYTSSIVALDAATGAYLWHYQVVPQDTWDYDATTDMVLADLSLDGKPVKALLQASKNGFFYVLDRRDGKLLSAAAFQHQTWADHIDIATGRPVEAPGARFGAGETMLWPGPSGAHGWQSMSYSPSSGLAYIPSLDAPGFYSGKGIERATWRPARYGIANALAGGADQDVPVGAGQASLVAWDPVRQRAGWTVRLPGAWPGGTLVTAGHLVFEGNEAGDFVAYTDTTGERRWQFTAGRAISAAPISYSLDGRQYVAVLADYSGGGPNFGGSMNTQHGWSFTGTGRRLLVFALDGHAVLPASRQVPVIPIDVPGLVIDPKAEARGSRLYATLCISCHGADVRSGGSTPDLRASPVAADRRAFTQVVKSGALNAGGMASFPELSADEIDALYLHIRARARAALVQPQTGAPPHS